MRGEQLQAIWEELSPERRKAITARAKVLHKEYNSLQTLRKALDVSQCEIAERLGVHQVSVSKIENRADLKLSTLRDYLASLGGTMKIVVDFPDQPSIVIKEF